MQRWAFGSVVGAAVAAAWLASPDLPSPARPWTVFLVTFLPALMVLQGRMMRGVDLGELPRLGVYVSSSLALWVLAGVSLAAALASGFTWQTLGLVALPPAELIGWSAALLAVTLGVSVAWTLLGARESALLEHLLPRSPGEKAAFVGVSVSAGVCEELVFRAFLIPALVAVTGSLVVAVIVSSAVFGFLHGYQGIIGILRTTLLGLLLAVPLVLTGSILPSMIVHFLLDVILGIWLAGWLLARSGR